MSNATVSSSGKTQGGTLHSVGGNGFDDYYANLTALFTGEPDAVDEVLDEFKSVLRPVKSTGDAYGATNVAPQNDPPRPGAGAPPGAPPLCPSHGRPAVWREGGTARGSGKPYSGFWKCPDTGESISGYGNSFKPACPERQQRG